MEYLLPNDEPLYKTLCGPLLSRIEVQAEDLLLVLLHL